MMRSSPKVGTLSLLLAISINFLSLPDIMAAPSQASQPSGLRMQGTPTGLPLPLSKMPSGDESNMNGMTHSEPQNRVSAALPNQAMSSETVHAAGSLHSGTNNEIAHGKQAEAAPSSHYGTTSLNGVGETSKVSGGQKVSSFVDFPPYTKPVSTGARYQRQRRSYPMPSLMSQEPPSSGPAFRFTRPDEVELRLDDDRDREAFLKLMALIANEEEQNNAGPDGVDDEDGIDLGSFQRPVANPYWTPLLGRPSEPINLMSSLLAEPPRTGSSLYGLGERPVLPLEIGMSPRATSLRDEDDTDGEWLEDSIPLHGSHYKTRRSGGGLNANTEFTFNPVKSHFRRYLRAVPLKSGLGMEFMPSGGRFGAIAGSRMSRRRRATGFPAAMHWM